MHTVFKSLTYVTEPVAYAVFLTAWATGLVVSSVLQRKAKRWQSFFIKWQGGNLLALTTWAVCNQLTPVVFIACILALIAHTAVEGVRPKRAKERKTEPAVPSAPERILCYAPNEEAKPKTVDLEDGSLCLSHVFGVIEKLSHCKLDTGDRLEVEKMRTSFSVYRTKRLLTQEDTRLLNDAMAHLLKMLAKYDV